MQAWDSRPCGSLDRIALGFLSIASVLSGAIGIESGLAVLTPFADALYGLGLVIVIAITARAGLPMKYLAIAGAVIGVGLFYKSAPHEFHIAAGIGFGLPHNGHVIMELLPAMLAEGDASKCLKSKYGEFLARGGHCQF